MSDNGEHPDDAVPTPPSSGLIPDPHARPEGAPPIGLLPIAWRHLPQQDGSHCVQIWTVTGETVFTFSAVDVQIFIRQLVEYASDKQKKEILAAVQRAATGGLEIAKEIPKPPKFGV